MLRAATFGHIVEVEEGGRAARWGGDGQRQSARFPRTRCVGVCTVQGPLAFSPPFAHACVGPASQQGLAVPELQEPEARAVAEQAAGGNVV